MNFFLEILWLGNNNIITKHLNRKRCTITTMATIMKRITALECLEEEEEAAAVEAEGEFIALLLLLLLSLLFMRIIVSEEKE